MSLGLIIPRCKSVSVHVVQAKMFPARSPRIRHRSELTERAWENDVQGLGNLDLTYHISIRLVLRKQPPPLGSPKLTLLIENNYSSLATPSYYQFFFFIFQQRENLHNTVLGHTLIITKENEDTPAAFAGSNQGEREGIYICVERQWIRVLLDFAAFIPIRLNLSNRGEFSWSWILVPCTPTSAGERKLNYNLNWIWNWIIVYYLSVYVLQKNVA